MKLILSFFKTYAQNFLFAFVVVLGAVTFLSISTYLYFAKDLVDKESVMNRNNSGVVLLDRYNRPFFIFYQAKHKIFVPLSEITRTAAVKTGTTEDYRDSWTIGYTPSLTIGAWVGNNDNTPMDNVAGSLGAAPIWKSLMEEFLKDKPIENFEKPPGIVALNICRNNGLLLKVNNQSGMKEYFVKGTEPAQFCYPFKPSLTPAP
ncbi:MAG: hypothetical protein Q7K55_08610 [Candidatus Levybacteria bacterium]|nr:hypothetical protein [Candidatus Levybacteria bacterium]